jgi:hypothetical protein
MIIIASTAAVAMIGTSGTALGKIPGLNGNGTMDDPYLVSSADDLRIVSESHSLHDGAYYKQTEDIVFHDDLSGNTVTLSVSVGKEGIKVALSVNVAYEVKEAYAYVSLNDSIMSVDWNGGFDDTLISISELRSKNSVIAAGSVNGETFAIGLNFTDEDDHAVITAPFKGNFKPIGSERPFTGTYNGNNRLITGLRIVVTEPTKESMGYAGLFAMINYSTLYGINIASEKHNRSYTIAVCITNTVSSFVTGGIAGAASNTLIASCSVDSTISSLYALTGSSSLLNQGTWLGGVAGVINGKIIDCNVSGTLSVAARAFIAMQEDTPMSFNTLILSLSAHMGGIAGRADVADIINSRNTAAIHYASRVSYSVIIGDEVMLDFNIKFTRRVFIGGTAGSVKYTNISNTYNSGELAASAHCLAERLDFHYSIIIMAGCFAYGDATVSKSYNTGHMSANCMTHTLHEDCSEYLHPIAPTDTESSYYLDNGVPDDEYNAVMITYAEMADQGTFEGWDFDRTWTMKDGRPEIWVRYDASIEDTSGTFDGTERYSLDREHNIDEKGIAFTQIGRDGFSLTLNKGYEHSDITLYMMTDDEKIILEKDGSNKYIIPSSFFLSAYMEDREISSIELFIDGLELFIPPAVEEIIDDIVNDIADLLSEGLGAAALTMICLLMTILAILTMYNARNTRSIMMLSDKREREMRETGENEHTG